MLNILLALKPHFTETDKENCIPIISRIVELSKIARRHGLLQLEEEIKQEDGLFLKMAIEMVFEGTDRKTIKKTLTHLILADNHSDFELLSRLIIAEGVLAIQSGKRPDTIQDMLIAMLGEKCFMQMRIARDEKEESERIKTSEQFLERMKQSAETGDELSQRCPLEVLITRMPDQFVQRVLKGVNSSDLTIALRGCGYDLTKKIFDNISEEVQRMSIVNDIEYRGPVRIIDVEEAQHKVIKLIGKLEESGDIRLR